MKYLKLVLLIKICLLMTLCESKSQKQNQPDEFIIGTLNFVIANHIANQENYEEFLLANKFSQLYTDSLLVTDLFKVDSVLNYQNTDYMVNQYNSFKGKIITPYLLKEYQDRITNKLIYRNGLVNFILSPPLFSLDKNNFVINLTACFLSEGEKKWDSIYLFFSKKDDKWKLEGIIKSNIETQNTSFASIGL